MNAGLHLGASRHMDWADEGGLGVNAGVGVDEWRARPEGKQWRELVSEQQRGSLV